MIDDQNTPFMNKLIKEIETIEADIRNLVAEKSALERLLMKSRRESAGIQDVNRKNSVSRVLIEFKIIEALELAKKPLTLAALYHVSRKVEIGLKETTFRTHLHRMKTKMIIENGPKRGTWQLVRPASDETA